jgi:hypothetical protein
MIINEKPGILEQIEKAVQPLTGNGEFHLESITFEDYDREITVIIRSHELEIQFQTTMRTHSRVLCYFVVHPVEKSFISIYLYPARGIRIPINDGRPMKERFPSENFPTAQKYHALIDYYLQETGFIQELNRQCNAIHAEMPEMRNFFKAENLEETIRLYLSEAKKQGKTGNQKLLDIKIQ